MRSHVALSISLATLLLAIPSDHAFGQSEGSLAADAIPTEVDATSSPTAVTVYLGRAAVTRSATVTLPSGVSAVRFSNLPESILPDTLQARAGDQGAASQVKVIGVDFMQRVVERAADPELAKLDARVASLTRDLTYLAQDGVLLDQQRKLVDAIGVRATGDASERGGTPQLDLAAVEKQLAFVAAQRMTLMKAQRELELSQLNLQRSLAQAQADRQARAGSSTVRRDAIVTVISPVGEQQIELTYLVANAGWEPIYNVRGTLDQQSTTIEYDAMLAQRTGEDWNNVALTLSTAQPAVAANPPAIQPWFVDVFIPPPPPPPGGFSGRTAASKSIDAAAAPVESAAPPSPMDRSDGRGGDAQNQAFRDAMKLAEDASVNDAGGAAVTFALPRTVTVKTNADRSQRTRIATINATPDFVHVAVPLLTESVYLRGRIKNTGSYQLLPGPASIFLGGDFIGRTPLASVAPGASFDLYFGIDRNLRAARKLVTRTTSKTGLLSGGIQVAWDYRIELDNPTPRPVKIEVIDRMIVSRDSKIEVSLTGPSVALSTDAEHLAEQRPLGILKWLLNVPAGATGPNAFVVTYGVRMDHAKDVKTTGVPE